ncbi:glutamate racemase [Bacteroidota bacterium]
MSTNTHPIGLFDSGVGGLTVAHAISALLPQERLVYYGDTIHLPYGDKSKEAIVSYSTGITDFLLENDCKVILIACNSASTNAFEEVKKHAGDRATILNVVDPVVDFVAAAEELKNIGVIGTKATISSNTYPDRIGAKNSTKNVSSLATPLFVPMIEEGFVFDDISNAIIRAYLDRSELEGIDSLILGCTHYPIIRNQISRYYNFDVNVLDTARIVAEYLQKYLSDNDLLSGKRQGKDKFYVSDHTPYFDAIARMFFNESIYLEKKSIW